jgi:hypothetical protein
MRVDIKLHPPPTVMQESIPEGRLVKQRGPCVTASREHQTGLPERLVRGMLLMAVKAIVDETGLTKNRREVDYSIRDA